MVFMRDWYIAWICSILFECCELTFRHWLPNFYECWWDHIFLDLFGCNLVGMIIGHYFLKYFSIPRFGWVRRDKKAEGQETEWWCLKDVATLLGVTAFGLVNLAVDCNNFFLKYLLWVPPDHELLKFRVIMMGLCALGTASEWYDFINNKNCKTLGPFAWCMILIACIETLITIKFSNNIFVEPFPLYVKVMWSVLGTVYAFLIATAWSNQ